MANLLAVASQRVTGNGPDAAMAATLPNIVFVMVDDMDARMVEDLPGLRALLADRGLTFTSAYTAAPVCCPARASFLRGQYPHNTGVLANGPPQGGFGAFRDNGHEASSVATWLQGAGYRTGLIGKYLNDYEKSPKHVPAGWNDWFVYAGEGKYLTYAVSDRGKIRQYGDKKKRNKHYQTDVLTRKAVSFISATPAAQPLFLYLTPSAPHEPATPAKRHKKSELARTSAPRVPSFNEEDVGDKPGIWKDRGLLTGSRIRDIDGTYARQLKSMLAVEEMLQDVIAALQAQNRLDNTYVVFASDNGYHHGEHRIGLDKNSPFEESTRTPLMVVGPGIPAGATTDAMVSLIDLGPTFAELAGVDPPSFVDGRSLVPLFDGNPPPDWRDAVISELLNGPNGGFRVLRTGPYVYTAYGNGERELYDLSVDPYQLDNIAGSAPQALLNELQARIDDFGICGSDGHATCQAVDGGS
jgi:N-acetylglucosamine-6-sulfatase